MKRVAKLIPVAVLSCAVACARGGTTAAPSSGPAASTASRAGTVHEDMMFSEALGVRKHLAVYLPPSYGRDPTRRFPVAYYLHGLNGTETDWLSKGSIDGVADSLFAAGAPEMIIVMPDGDDGWWTTWVEQNGFRACADTLRAEAPDRYCVAHHRYDEYIARDVVRHIDATYRTKAGRDTRGIGGLSMGGYGALSIALRYPDVFGAAASHSGVVLPLYAGPRPFAEPIRYATTIDELRPTTGNYWSRYLRFWGTDLERWRAADPVRAAESIKSRGQRLPALFFDCGRDDGFVDQNRALHSALDRLGVPHEYAEWPGAHNWLYWHTHVRESLAWMGRRLSD